MKAYVINSLDSTINLEERDIPKLDDGEVLLKVHKWSICRTDISHLKNQLGTNANYKITGHEVLGEIVGTKDPRLKIGEIITYMGDTDFKGAAEYRKLKCILSNDTPHGQDGSLIEWEFKDRKFIDVKNAAAVTKIDKTNKEMMRYGSLVEPLCCVLRVTENRRPEPEKNIIILGGGAIGNLAYQCFRNIYDAEKIIVIDIDRNKLDYMNETYEDEKLITIHNSAGSEMPAEAERIINKTKGAFGSYLFDALPPLADSISQVDTRYIGANLLKPNGTYFFFSATTLPETTTVFWPILAKGINLTSVGFDQRAFPMEKTAQILDMAYAFAESGVIDLKKIVTNEVDFYSPLDVQKSFYNYGEADHLLKTIVSLVKE